MKYHVNPATGEAGICTAQNRCLFGDSISHHETPEAARRNYEQTQERVLAPNFDRATGKITFLKVTSRNEMVELSSLLRNLYQTAPNREFEVIDPLNEEPVFITYEDSTGCFYLSTLPRVPGEELSATKRLSDLLALASELYAHEGELARS